MKRILFLFGGLGPPADYVLSRVKRYGEVYVYLAAEPNPATRRILESHATAFLNQADAHGGAMGDDELREALVAAGRELRADALVTFDEFRLVVASQAAAALGLRGVGAQVELTRNKWRMRRAFTAAGVPSPKFVLVDGPAALERACDELRFPFVMKAAGGAAGFGLSIVASRDEAASRWEAARATLRAYAATNKLYAVSEFLEPAFVAEEIIQATTRSWYPDGSGYGDYVSVEGLVCAGRYYPFAVTSRTPTIYPFVERAGQTPCTLPEELQLKIAEGARAAVTALGSEFCGTHTELKLMANNELCVIETAARLGGSYNVAQVEHVYGASLVDALMQVLLEGGSDMLPERMFVGPGNGAAGTLSLLPADEHGVPWDVPPCFHTSIDWSRLVTPGTTVEINWSKALPDGKRIPQYDAYKGAMNRFGTLFLKSRTPEILLRDQYAIVRGLRAELERIDAELGAPA